MAAGRGPRGQAMSDFAVPATLVFLFFTLFFFWSLYRWLGPRPCLAALALPCLALSFWYPVIKLLERQEPWSTLIAVSGNVWVAAAALFTGIILLLEIIRALLWLLFERSDGEGRDVLPPRRSVPLALILLAVLTGYAAFEAQYPRVTHIAIQTDKLPQGVDNYRVAFVADIHLNALNGERLLGRVTKIIQEQQADLLLLGGDIVGADGMRARRREAAMLAAAMPPNGTLAVLGNHEAYNDHLNNAIPFLKRAWAHVMRGEAVAVGSVYVVGVDDPAVAEAQGSTAHDPMIILRRIPHERFVILLKHRPDIQPESIGLFDVQLSAHTHGGQLWPAGQVLRFIHGAPQGRLTRLESKLGASWYYCTSGAGFSALPLRFLTPPEVVVLDLIR